MHRELFAPSLILVALVGLAAPASAQLFWVMPIMPEADVVPAPIPTPPPPPTYQWPARYAGCDEVITIVLGCYADWNEQGVYGQPGTTIAMGRVPPFYFTGWGADLVQRPGGGTVASAGPLLVDSMSVDSSKWRTVARTRDADGLAAVAWPTPQPTTSTMTLPGGEPNTTGQPMPSPGGFYGVPQHGSLRLARINLRVPPGTPAGDWFVSFSSTPGDITEGLMTTTGRLSPQYDGLPGVGVNAGEPKFQTLIRIVPFRRCPADIAGQNQGLGPDGWYTADDIIVFFNRYYAQHPLADIASANQVQEPDGAFTADDIIVFLNWYFAGCTDGGTPCTAGRLAGGGSGTGAGGSFGGEAWPDSSAPSPSTGGQPASGAPSRAGPGTGSGAGSGFGSPPALTPAEVAALQQLISALPLGPQREALQAQLTARQAGPAATQPNQDDR